MNLNDPTQDFDPWYWHDCEIHGLRFDVGDFEAGDCTNDLVLDIDFIVEWVQCNPIQFRVAPATLVFHNVTNVEIHLPQQFIDYQVAVARPSIHSVQRKLIENQKVHMDVPYYVWELDLDYFAGKGKISFGATGFTQTLRREPVLVNTRRLPSATRDSDR